MLLPRGWDAAPECGGWNTLVEEAEVTPKASKSYLPG